jgi:hypothetical protein
VKTVIILHVSTQIDSFLNKKITSNYTFTLSFAIICDAQNIKKSERRANTFSICAKLLNKKNVILFYDFYLFLL